jgi:hypothetical protein
MGEGGLLAGGFGARADARMPPDESRGVSIPLGVSRWAYTRVQAMAVRLCQKSMFTCSLGHTSDSYCPCKQTPCHVL